MNRELEPRWQELHDLVVAQLTDELTDAQHLRLEQLLEGDALARRIYLESMHDIGVLHEVLCPIEAQAAAAEDSVNVWARVRLMTLRMLSRPAQFSLLTAALVLLVIVGTLAYVSVPPPSRTPRVAVATTPEVVAQVTGLYQVEWEQGQAHVPYQSSLLSGQVLHLKKGVTEITFRGGAVVLLEGPASLELIGEGSGYLHAGKLTANVPQRAHGFRVDTALAPVVDLGTQFGVATEHEKSLEVYVFRGRVVVEASSHLSERVIVNAGNSLHLQRGAPALVKESNKPAKFVFTASYETPARWQTQRQKLEADPDLIAYYAFAQDPERRARLANSGASGNRLDGFVLSATWKNGRWNDKDALSFGGPDSHTYVDLGEDSARELNFSGPFSVAAWFRVGGGGRDWPAIVAKGDGAWRLHVEARTGRLSFGTFPAQPLDLFSHTRATDGRWHLGVAVYEPSDGGVKKLFIDGRLEATQEIDQPIAATDAHVFIGENADRLGREFFGLIDEVAIFRRALSEAEVKAMFDAGNPYAPPGDISPAAAAGHP